MILQAEYDCLPSSLSQLKQSIYDQGDKSDKL